MHKVKLLPFLLFLSVCLWAEIPVGYYQAAEGKKDAVLKTALFNIIRTHTQLEYYSSSTHFRSTDWHPDGYFWDMYSSNKRTSWSGLNREHCMPKSWFGISSGQENSAPISTDLNNLYPSDPNANQEKSNYPLGETGSSLIYTNGVSKVGKSAFAGYSGTVFEPADEYKGDFARTYMYMVTCYEDYSTAWQSTGTSSMLYQNTYPVFKPYAVNLLLKWHRNDPVSEKELNRNDAVYDVQHNRNPYIDYPALAEYIWGNGKGKEWDASSENYPVPEYFNVSYKHINKQLTVKLTPVSNAPYMVYSLEGRRLLSGTLTSATTTITLSELNTGTYLLIVNSSQNKYAKLFLVY